MAIENNNAIANTNYGRPAQDPFAAYAGRGELGLTMRVAKKGGAERIHQTSSVSRPYPQRARITAADIAIWDQARLMLLDENQRLRARLERAERKGKEAKRRNEAAKAQFEAQMALERQQRQREHSAAHRERRILLHRLQEAAAAREALKVAASRRLKREAAIAKFEPLEG